jgi:hypothetical protein
LPWFFNCKPLAVVFQLQTACRGFSIANRLPWFFRKSEAGVREPASMGLLPALVRIFLHQ